MKIGSMWKFRSLPTLFESEISNEGILLNKPTFIVLSNQQHQRIKVVVCGSGSIGWISCGWFDSDQDNIYNKKPQLIAGGDDTC